MAGRVTPSPDLQSLPAIRGAVLSVCGTYRYRLWRHWAPSDDGPHDAINFIMLNPSTADAEQDDATIRRCIGYARRWNYGGIVVTNLFALRATDPRQLRKAADPVGPHNDEHLYHAAHSCDGIVCAWGRHGSLYGRDQQVRRLLSGRRLAYLDLCKDGAPKHPLYLPLNLEPQVWP